MRDMRNVASPLRRQANLVGVVRFVRTQVLLNGLGRGPQNGQGLKGWAEALAIVNIGTRQGQAQGDPLTVDDKVSLRSKLAPIGRILAGLIPPFTGAGMVTLSIVCHCHSMPLSSSYSRRQSFQSLAKPLALTHC